MDALLMVISVLLIALVLLQSGKASSSGILNGSTSELLKNRKERGAEKFISNATYVLGISFFVICFIMAF